MSFYSKITPTVLKNITFARQPRSEHWTGGKHDTKPTPKGTKEWSLRDTAVPGLFLRLTQDTISWYIQRKQGSQSIKLCIGHWWSADGGVVQMGLEEARTQAYEDLALIRRGGDPRAERKRLQREAKEELARAAAEEKVQTLTMGCVFDKFSEDKFEKDSPGNRNARAQVKRWMSNSPLWNVSIYELNESHIEKTYGPLLRLARKREKEMKEKREKEKREIEEREREREVAKEQINDDRHDMSSDENKCSDENKNVLNRNPIGKNAHTSSRELRSETQSER